MSNLEMMLSIAMTTPMDDPRHPDCRWGAPILLWGPPGIGKSGRVETAGDDCGLPVETVYLSTLQPEDISGIPMPDGNGGVTTVAHLGQLQSLIKAKRGILFLDELTCARPAVQGAGLGVVYNRRFAGNRLPGGIRVVGAANPADQAAGGWNLAPPMANRLLHLDVEVPSLADWTSWLLSGANRSGTSMQQGEDILKNKWAFVWAKTQGLGAGFIKRKGGDVLYKLPPVGHKDRGRAWASPRSWEVALRCAATCEALGHVDMASDLVSASVGPGMGTEWAAWVAEANLPDPEDVLENGWTPNRARLDIAVAVYSSAIAWALSKTDKVEQRRSALKAWGLLNSADQHKLVDLALSPAAALMTAGYTTKAGADFMAVARDLTAKFGTTGMANYVNRRP